MHKWFEKLVLTICLFMAAIPCFAETDAQPQGEWLREVLTQPGDNPDWADPDFDDQDWVSTDFHGIKSKDQIFWVRRWVEVDPLFEGTGTPIGLYVSAMAASEIFWNGEFLGSNGVPASNAEDEVPGKIDFTVFLPASKVKSGPNLLALRMSSHHIGADVYASLYELTITRYRPPLQQRANLYAPVVPTLGIFVFGLLYFGFAAAVQKRRGAAWLSMASLMIMVQMTAEISRAYVQYEYDWHLIRLGLVWLGAAGFGLSTAAFLSEHLFGRMNRLYAGVLVTLVLLTLFLPGWDSKTAVALFVCFGASLAIAALGLKNRRRSGLILFLVMALTSLLAVYYLGWLLDRTIYFLFTGFLMVLFALEVQASRKLQQALVDSRLRASRLELEMLKKQIEPHFVMNTLTALSEWIEANPRKGVEMIDALADEFRLIHDLSQQDLVSLQEELALCDRHLELMAFRRKGEFRLERELEDKQARIPPAVLHTLVENGLTHGSLGSGITFRIQQYSEGNQMVYRFSGPGSKEGKPQDSQEGIGHAYIRSRLLENYGEAASFTSGEDEQGGWTSIITIPVS